MLTRRALLGALAAPAIIRPGILMPIKPLWTPGPALSFLPCDGRRVDRALYPLLAAVMEDYGLAPLPNLPPGYVVATGAGHLPAGSIFLHGASLPRIESDA